MSDAEGTMPAGLVSETREGLEHYYDFAYLSRHPILSRLPGLVGDEPSLAVQKLRRLLLEVLEELRPLGRASIENPDWRPYLALQRRYILCEPAEVIERDLAIGARQRQREERRGVEALALALWGRQRLSETRGPEDLLRNEIVRASSESRLFSAGEQLARALEAVRAFAEDCQVELVCQYGDEDLQLEGDPALLKQLLVTALSFVLRLARQGRLVVSLRKGQGNAVCSLSLASGRASSALSHAGELPATVQALAESQRAALSRRRTSDGWCLDIVLPISEKRRTVAIIEDNQDFIALVTRYLAGQGYQLLTLSDSSTAIERVGETQPDVVLLDVMMGGVDGWELLQSLKSDPQLRQIPVAVCSVLDEPELAASLGADAYLRKPIRPAELLACLARLLPRARNAPATSLTPPAAGA
jgi:CheY-like chemotaxis protein